LSITSIIHYTLYNNIIHLKYYTVKFASKIIVTNYALHFFVLWSMKMLADIQITGSTKKAFWKIVISGVQTFDRSMSEK